MKYVTSGETARRRDGYGEIGKIDLDFEASQLTHSTGMLIRLWADDDVHDGLNAT